MEKLKSALNKISGGRVLDVGTGVGEFIDILKGNLKDYIEIIGIDTNEKALEKSNSKFSNDNIIFINMDAEHISFEDNTFDVVCVSNSIHHLPNTYKVLNEMKRVLKPGGYFIIQEMFSDNQNEKQLTHVYYHHLAAEIQTLLGGYHNKTLKKQEILDIGYNLELEDLEDFECIYEDDEEISDEELEKMINGLEDYVTKVQDFPGYESYKAQAEIIKHRFCNIGIASATELVMIGKKLV